MKATFESKTARAELEKGRESVLKTRRSIMQAIGKVLTRSQRSKYDAMLGEPFDFAKARPGALKSEAEKPKTAEPEQKKVDPAGKRGAGSDRS